MINDLLQLAKPLQYLSINHTRRMVYQIACPLFLLFFTCLFVLATDKSIGTVLKGFFSQSISILQLMIPFSITALAAVAAFPSKNLDSNLSGIPTPFLIRRKRGKIIKDKLTRRRYLCFLFGYLSFVGICVLLLLWVLPASESFFKEGMKEYIDHYRWAVFSISVFLMSNILVNTLLGLFYLSDRMHRD